MIQLIVLLILAACFAIIFKYDVDKMLPPVCMGTFLISYIFSITVGLKYSMIFALLVLALFVGFALGYKHRQGTLEFDLNSVKKYGISKAFIVWIVVSAVFALLVCTHKIFHWDDLNHWGIYTKTLYALDAMPKGVENCSSYYKDYPPLQQLVQYLFISGKKTFCEPALFAINIAFMYMMLLPLLWGMENKNKFEKIGMTLLYLTFPHVFTTQFYYKLGIDYLMSVVFGYALFWIFNRKDKGVFRIVCIVCSLSYLALIKNAGIVLSLFGFAFYFAHELIVDGDIVDKRKIKKTVLNTLMIMSGPLLLYLSWEIFRRKTGNYGYLSSKINDNIKSLNHLFPEYTGGVLANYLKHIFKFALTREKFGMTAFGILLIIGVVFFLKSRFYSDRHEEYYKRIYIMLMAGFTLFCIAHIYMYLFVFDDWEAYALLEFDRYICQYLAGFFLYALCGVWDVGNAIKDKMAIKVNPPWLLLAVFVIVLPFGAMKTYLIPSNYDSYYEGEWAEKANRALEEYNSSGIPELNLTHDANNRLMIVANAWSDELQFLLLDLVPQPVTHSANVPSIEAGTFASYISSQLEQKDISYVYIMNNAMTSYAGDIIEESKQVTVDGEPIKAGTIYKVNRDNKEHYLLEKY